jgi:predicted porin
VNQKTAPGLKSTGFLVAGGYDNGPLSALLAIGNAKNTTSPVNATTDGKVNDFGLGASYDLGFAVPYVQFEQSKNSAIPGPGYDKVRSFEVGSKFPLGAFTPYITLSAAKFKDNVSSTGKARGFQIGSTYDISKRTYVYGAFGSDKATETNVAPGATAGVTKNTGYALGLVHSF